MNKLDTFIGKLASEFAKVNCLRVSFAVFLMVSLFAGISVYAIGGRLTPPVKSQSLGASISITPTPESPTPTQEAPHTISRFVTTSTTTPTSVPVTSQQSTSSNSSNNSATPTATPTPTYTQAPTVTPTVLLPTNTPTPVSTSTIVPTATLTPTPAVETADFSYSLHPRSTFTTNGYGEVKGTVYKNANGYWDAKLEGHFVRLLPGRTYQLWICDQYGCGSNGVTCKFVADSLGNGSISNATITFKNPVNKMALWESPAYHQVTPIPQPCLMDHGVNSVACLETNISF